MEHVRGDHAGERGGRKETGGRSEKEMEKRRVRKTEEEISKGRMWWKGRKSAWMEGEDDEGQGGLCYSSCWGLVVPALSSV